MKKLLIILLCLVSYGAMAQTIVQGDTVNARSRFRLNGYRVNGISNDSTTSFLRTDYLITEWAAKRYADGINGSFVKYSDTAAMLLGYTRLQRLYDSLTQVRANVNSKLNLTDTSAMLLGYVRKTRLINTNAPLLGGGSLANDLTLSVDTGRVSTKLVTGGTLNKVRDSLSALIPSSGFGTITSIATNNATGITGGTITTTGTLAIDTLGTIETRKRSDSTAMRKVNFTDTLTMLTPYLRKSDTANMLAYYMNNVGYGLRLLVTKIPSVDSTVIASKTWVLNQGYGPGTVTSVGLSLPSIFNVTVSPITTSGTLTAQLAQQQPNVVFAGPVSSPNAAPTFRGLVAADLPVGSGYYIQNQTGSNLAAQTAKFWITDTVKTNGPVVAVGNVTGLNVFAKANGVGNSYIYRAFKPDGTTQLVNIGQTGNNDGYIDLWSSGGSQNWLLQGNGNSFDSTGYPFLINTKSTVSGSNVNTMFQVAGSVLVRDTLKTNLAGVIGTTLSIGSIPALASAATTFLTTNAGIVNSRTAAQVLNDIGAISGLTGDVVATGPGSVAATIQPNVVTYAKFQQVAASSLVGNPTGSLANAQGITLGATLNFTGTSLQTNALTGDITTPANSFVTTLATVNTNVGSWGTASTVPTFTVNGKGLITAAANVSIQIAESQVTNLTTDLASKANLSGATFTGNVILNADPTTALGAATKGYVDNLVTGLSWKQAVRAATTANITLSGTQTVDGIALAANDRVLVKNQTTASQNGLYLVAAGSWTRTSDATTGSQILGSAVYIQAGGTANGGTQYTNGNTTAPVVGTDAITYQQIAGAGTYTNGTYLSLTGNVFDVGATYSSNWNTAYNRSATSLGFTASTFTLTKQDATTLTVAVPTFNQNTTGTAANITGVAAIPNGGTGQTTAAAAFNALSPMTTAGDIIYGGTAGAGTRLAAGTATQVLHGGTVPSWSAVSLTADVTGLLPNANLANSQVTINGSAVSLGGSITVTATASQALTIGTGLSGGSYNGSAAVTIANTGVLSIAGTTNQITASAATGAITLSIPSTFVAPGSIAATTSVSAVENSNVASGVALYLKRAADVSPVGYLIQAQNNAANANLFTVDASGNIIATSLNAALSNTLTFGSGLTAGSYNNSSAQTISIATAGVTNAMLANSSVTVNGVAISLGGSGTITASTTAALTMNNSGTGAASGTTFNGGTAQTLSYNTIGAPSTTGTNASGTWGISITGNAATVTNGVYTTSSFNLGTTSIALNRASAAQSLTGVSIDGTAGSIAGFNNPTTAATANTIVYRDASGYINANYYYNSNSDVPNTSGITAMVGLTSASAGPGYFYKFSSAAVQSFIGLTTGNWVDLTSSQTISGAKTFTTALTNFGNTSVTYGQLQIGTHINGVGAGIYNKNLTQQILYSDNVSLILTTPSDFYLRTTSSGTDRWHMDVNGNNTWTGSGTFSGLLTASAALTVTTPQPASLATSGTAATQVLAVTGGKGGNTTGTTGQVGGTGALVNITAGAGGDAPSGSTNGSGGNVIISSGAAGAGAGSAGSLGAVVLQAGGTARLNANTNGVDITGTVTATSNGQINGSLSVGYASTSYLYNFDVAGTTRLAGALTSNSLATFNAGVTVASSALSTSGAISAAQWTTSGVNLKIAAATYTDNSTAASTTVATNMVNSIGIPTLAATNTGVVYTNAATVYIAGAAAAGTNVTLTNTYSLYIAAGNSYTAGNWNAAGFFNNSDRSLKYNITETPGVGFDNVTFMWKDHRDDYLHYGYIAQDVQKVLPGAVNKGADGKLNVNYGEANAYKIAQLEKEIQELKLIIKEIQKHEKDRGMLGGSIYLPK